MIWLYAYFGVGLALALIATTIAKDSPHRGKLGVFLFIGFLWPLILPTAFVKAWRRRNLK